MGPLSGKPVLRVLAVLLLWFSVLSLSAQEKDPLRAYRPEVLEVYLERADRQKRRENWLKLAEAGGAAAEAAWEQAAALLFESGAALQEARIVIRERISERAAERFAEWLVRRFFEEHAPRSFELLYAAVQQQNLAHLYVTLDGRIQRDSSFDPMLKDRGGLEQDQELWREAVTASIGAALSQWGQGIEAAVPELLIEAPEERRAALAARVANCAALYREGYRRELDALYQQEQARFMALRSYDQYSLRRKNEEAAAQAVADRLIQGTRQGLTEGIRNLEQGLQEPSESGAGQLQIDSRRWLESFAGAFEAGLDRWDRAERSFLAERVRWERQAGKDYQDGELAWARAFQSLQLERSRWEGQIRRILDSGKAQWAARQAELASAIETASAELDREIQQRSGAMAQRVESLVEMYGQASAMLRTAEASGRYWLDKLNVDLPLTAPLEQIAAQARPDPAADRAQALEQIAY